MSDPITWTTLQLVEERLKAISRASGYHGDIGAGTVTLDPRNKREVGSNAHTLVFALSVDELPESSSRRTKASEMDISIESIVPFAGTENPALVAHRCRADIVRALADGAWRAAAGIRSLDIQSSRFDVGNDGEPIVIATVTARAGLAESIPPA